MNPARIRHLVKKVEVNEEHTTHSKIYVDFWDQRRVRWYVIFVVDQRTFGRAVTVLRHGEGGSDVRDDNRQALLSLIPPHILARCTAATLGIESPPPIMARSETDR